MPCCEGLNKLMADSRRAAETDNGDAAARALVLRVGGRSAGVAFGILAPQLAVEANAFEGAVDYRFQFAGVLNFASFRQPLARITRTEPGRIPLRFVWSALLVDFHQKRLDHKFLYPARLPEHALGMNIKMKVARLERAQSARFFRGLALGGLTVR